MVILRFKIHSKPDKSDELMAALAEIITPARDTEGVVEFDIARVLRDPDFFIATAIYEDGAALERQESLPEVHRVMAMPPDSLVAPPERTIFDAAVDPIGTSRPAPVIRMRGAGVPASVLTVARFESSAVSFAL